MSRGGKYDQCGCVWGLGFVISSNLEMEVNQCRSMYGYEGDEGRSGMENR